MQFVDKSLAQRLEMAHTMRSVKYATAQAWLQPQSGSTVEAVADGFAIFAGPNSPLNKASGLGFEQPATDEVLQQVEHFYAQQQCVPTIELCPLADPSWQRLLMARGYRLAQFFNVLAREIPYKPLPVALPARSRISEVTSTHADLWIETTARGFDDLDQPAAATLAIMAPNYHSEIARCYLAWVDDQPASGGAMATSGAVTEFGGTSTRPTFRRRGLQMALLHTRLNAAREMGCDLAMVLTTPGSRSQKNIERAGFRLAYTKAIMVGPS